MLHKPYRDDSQLWNMSHVLVDMPTYDIPAVCDVSIGLVISCLYLLFGNGDVTRHVKMSLPCFSPRWSVPQNGGQDQPSGPIVMFCCQGFVAFICNLGMECGTKKVTRKAVFSSEVHSDSSG